MKKSLLLVFLTLFVNFVICTAEVTQTLTIDSPQLSQMRMSLLSGSTNYDGFIAITRNQSSDIPFPDDVSPSPLTPSECRYLYNAASYLNNGLFGNNYPNQQNNNLSSINSALDYLGNRDFVTPYFTARGVNPPRRALDLIYLLVNTSMLYDCLYYEAVYTDPDNFSKLKRIMEDGIDVIEAAEVYFTEQAGTPIADGKAYWQYDYTPASDCPYPSFVIPQYRFNMYTAMGLASILLYKSALIEGNLPEAQLMLERVNHVDEKLLSDLIPAVFPLENQSDSMIAFHTSRSGAYIESQSYLIQLIGEAIPYFLARKRISTTDLSCYNYFDNSYLISWANDVTLKITPSLDDWPYNDTHYATTDFPSRLNPFPAECYYNSSTVTDDILDNYAWYYQSKISEIGNKFITHGNVISNNFQVLYSSNPDIPLAEKILNRSIANPIPAHGSISNSEFTILRKQTSTNVTEATAGLINDPSMYIVHENCFNGGHGHADQASFTFYNKGQYFLIDPGYLPYNEPLKRKWGLSPYGHNMVILKPDTVRENNTIAGITQDIDEAENYHYRPRGAFRFYNRTSVSESMIVEDPCIKDYFQKSNDLDILRLKLTYDDTNFPSDHPELALPIADLDRTFIRDNDIFVVYDNVQTRLNCGPYEAWNLLHFGSNTAITPADNTYALTVGSETIDLVCGTPNQQNSTASVASYPNSSELSYNYHSRSKTVVSSSSNPRFLNVIIPRSDDPVISRVEQVLSTTGQFATKVRSWSSTDPATECRTYIGGQTSASNNFTFSDRIIETDADLFLVSCVNTLSELIVDNSFVMNKGAFLTIGSTRIADTFTNNLESVSVEYKSSRVDVTLNNASLIYPRMRFYRNGVDADHFSARIRIPDANPVDEPVPMVINPDFGFVTTDIIQSLAYDETYFYVNYSFLELTNGGCDDGDLVIVKGELPVHTRSTDLGIAGDVTIAGIMTIQSGVTVSISADSDLSFAENAGIINSGYLSIQGEENEGLVYLRNSSGQWMGLVNHVDGELTCEGAVIEGAVTAIILRGSGLVKNCTISQCGDGISVTNTQSFEIRNNTIHSCGTAVTIANVVMPEGSAYITNNAIYNNSNGIRCYNSSPMINDNNIHDNSDGGMVFYSESCPIVVDNLISNSGSTASVVPEIRLEKGSYPILDDGRNDINTDGSGYALFYRESSDKLKHLEARNNFWSFNTEQTILNTISPSNWSINVVPFCNSANTPYYIPEDPFKMALSAESGGDFETAVDLYRSIASSTPDSLVAIQSLGRLNNMYALSDTLVPDLRSVYAQFISACSDSTNEKSAEHLEIMLDRIDGNYPSALSSYEQLLNNSTCTSDSLVYLLDIAYTIEEMLYDDSNKSENTGLAYYKYGLNITSRESALYTINSLWDRIFLNSEISDGYTYQTPATIRVSNYPNPFNPTTTIKYSLPQSGMIQISLYNIKGQWIKDLINEDKIMGNYKLVWDGTDAGGRSVSSGIYFVRAKTAGRYVNHKIMLLK